MRWVSWAFIFYTVVGVVTLRIGMLWERWFRWRNHKKYEMKLLWKCPLPICEYSIRTNDAEALMKLAASHMERHT